MTLIDGRAPTILTAEGARRLTARIRDALALADDLLAQALEGRAWEALGYDSFEAYCAGELPDLRHIKLRKPERLARHKKIFDAGGTERQAAASSNSSVGTAHNDRVALEGRAVLKNEQTDAPALEPCPLPVVVPEMVPTNWQTVVRHVVKAGAAGLSCQAFEEQTGWSHGRASAAFHSAERKGWIYRPGQFTETRYALYVAVAR